MVDHAWPRSSADRLTEPLPGFRDGWRMLRERPPDLAATRMATMRWGTFVLSAEPVTEPPVRAAKAWAETGQPREHLWDLAIGETRTR